MKILAIETSCDETAIAILECLGNITAPYFEILGDALYSQVSRHQEYGGVYPNLAKRLHAQNLIPLLKETLKQAHMLAISNSNFLIPNEVKGILEREHELFEQFLEFIPTIEKPNIDAIAVTQGPGLEPALWVGLNFAKALSFMWNVPLIPVNHMEGHIVSVLWNKQKISDKSLIPKVEFPAIALLISGGHTELVLVKDLMEYGLIGQTRDDAVGEAFDKVARLLGLPYPGGPQISTLAESARSKPKESYSNIMQNVEVSEIQLPRPMINSSDYDFSFSGLKTAVLYLVKKLGILSPEMKEYIALEFENAVVDVLLTKTKKALMEYGAHTLLIGGGVIANTAIRRAFEKLTIEHPFGITLHIPDISLTTDNAVMIGFAGYIRYKQTQSYHSFNPHAEEIRAHGTLKLSTKSTTTQ